MSLKNLRKYYLRKLQYYKSHACLSQCVGAYAILFCMIGIKIYYACHANLQAGLLILRKSRNFWSSYYYRYQKDQQSLKNMEFHINRPRQLQPWFLHVYLQQIGG